MLSDSLKKTDYIAIDDVKRKFYELKLLLALVLKNKLNDAQSSY